MKTKLCSRHMEFLYRLTRANQRLNHEGLSKSLMIENKHVTAQTIQNWFRNLKQHRLQYYHSVIFEKLGLVSFFVLCKGIPPDSPYRNAVWTLVDPRTLEKNLLAHYLVPQEYCTYFRKYVGKKNSYYQLNSCFVFSAPFHKTMKASMHDFSKLERKDIEHTMAKFRDYLKEMQSISSERILARDPLLLPVIIESRKCQSSVDIWNAIKRELGRETWKYVSKRRSMDDGVGVKRVQQEIQLLNGTLNHLVLQIDVEYDPLIASTVSVALFVTYEDRCRFIDFIEEMALKCARMVIYPNCTKALVIMHMQACGMKKLLSSQFGIHIQRMFFVQSNDENHQFNYAKSFDPVQREWKPMDLEAGI